jgi:hypothetical protein
MERLGDLAPDAAPALQRFAEAWDRGRFGPSALLPAPGRIGTGAVEEASGLRPECVAFLAGGSLRPALDAHFTPYREYLRDGDWRRGVCPFCGAPPGFADVLEGGHRKLICHLCGGAWLFARAQCPFCGTESSSDLARLELEEKEQGYVVWGCQSESEANMNGPPAAVASSGGPGTAT